MTKFTALISVYEPVYDPSVKGWRFMFGDHPEYFDISETSIAHDAIDRGGALIGDTYEVMVRLDQTITNRDTGTIRNHYSIISVENFWPGKLQGEKK